MKNLKLEELSIEQKLGMVMCARTNLSGDRDVDFTLELIRNHALGAFQRKFPIISVIPTPAWESVCIRKSVPMPNPAAGSEGL